MILKFRFLKIFYEYLRLFCDFKNVIGLKHYFWAAKNSRNIVFFILFATKNALLFHSILTIKMLSFFILSINSE